MTADQLAKLVTTLATDRQNLFREKPYKKLLKALCAIFRAEG